MKNNLWRWTDNLGSFESKEADKIKTLYFPLCNEVIMSSISPDLHGDIKSNQNSFLLTPVSRNDLIDSKVSRNFWIYLDKKIWSTTGVSKDLRQIQNDRFKLEAGLLWHKVSRENKEIGLKAEVLSFVPAGKEPVEIMQVKITNVSKKLIKFTPIAAIPIYARGANNIRDHRHVTSLLQRITLHKYGVIVRPALIFDEAGHKPNKTNYFVLGCSEKVIAPQYIYPTQEMFCGDGGDLEAPQSLLENILPVKDEIQGKEAMATLRFNQAVLLPGKSRIYIILMGITEDRKQIGKIFKRFNSVDKVKKALGDTKKFWVDLSSRLNLPRDNQDVIRQSMGEITNVSLRATLVSEAIPTEIASSPAAPRNDTLSPPSFTDRLHQDFNNWFRWVSIQPVLRKIFGCSFLPDFDYGKGGRGWRDLWQDCLGLILNDSVRVRPLLVNNFSGVRIDGSNATIIRKEEGGNNKERAGFIADRNDISRIWMDHGVWPLLTLNLYLDKTADFNILFEEIAYFRDQHIYRSRLCDRNWKTGLENKLKTISGKIYKGTILEHVLVQNLTQFFNVGSHNFLRLEGGDWNDGLDMACERGESIAFSCMYAQNLKSLAELLKKINRRHIKIAKEIKILLGKINYNNIKQKQALLNNYFAKTKSYVLGSRVDVDVSLLADNLLKKSEWMIEYIRRSEWVQPGFFNGYYDDKKRRVEGIRNNLVRMSLVSQAFPIMSGVATEAQIKEILKNVNKYLFDKKLKGYRLNTDFKEEEPALGRAFSFAYGNKENGAFFNHMVVLFAYALNKRGFVKEAQEILNSIYNMCVGTKRSKIYPCIPEYFDAEGRGMYSYLTGSASWFVLTSLLIKSAVKRV
ncbi:MAG: cellobiose phosphorylase [Candidatus Omnitrophota bacterium]|nr:cellobiose phosphorylase [Candidatus Omnitrophota bacterium]